MDLVILVLGIALVGFLVWLITTKIPMGEEFKMGIRILVAILVALYVIRRLGVHLPNFLN
jgi:hypothetical protein